MNYGILQKTIIVVILFFNSCYNYNNTELDNNNVERKQTSQHIFIYIHTIKFSFKTIIPSLLKYMFSRSFFSHNIDFNEKTLKINFLGLMLSFIYNFNV